ncbi:MAG: QueT transporter family protein [bacterium]
MRPDPARRADPLTFLTRGALIASLYLTLTLLFAGVSFQAVQIRVAEALTILPFFFPEAIWGVALGVALANLFSPFGVIDLVCGSLLSLIAALGSYMAGRLLRPHLLHGWAVALAVLLAPLFPVLANGFGVSWYLLQFGLVSDYTYWGLTVSILIGQTVACYGLGGPLLLVLTMRWRETGKIF